MYYFQDHLHTTPIELKKGTGPTGYAEIVGTVEKSTERQIVGKNGQHLQFYVDIKPGIRYQVDVNVQSRDGSQVWVYAGDETLVVQSGGTPYGDPAYGAYKHVAVSYGGLGLKDSDFIEMPDTRIESLLEQALNGSQFVAIYGVAFDDGGPNGKGIHDIHFNPNFANQDGAIAVYMNVPGGGTPIRKWFFFKFSGDTIGS